MIDSCIDVFNHCLPQRYVAACKSCQTKPLVMFDRAVKMPGMSDCNQRLEIMNNFPGYRQILSLSSPSPEIITTPEKAPDLARIGNETMADWCAENPNYFPGFVATLPLNHPEAALHEADYAIRELGALGIQLYTHVNGLPLDRPEFLALFEKMAELDRPVWLHPLRSSAQEDYLGEGISKYDLWWAFGWPHETSVCAGRLVFAGIFDRWPGLKIITHHAGGTIPMMEGRLRHGLKDPSSRYAPDQKKAIRRELKMEPVEAFRKFYADTATFGSLLAIEAGLSFFGTDHCLFATDFPFAGIEESLTAAEGMPRAIFETNAKRVLNLQAL